MSGSGREAFLNVRVWFGVLPESPGVVRRPFRMSGNGRRPSRMSGSGWEAHPNVQEWLRGPPGYPVVVGWPSQMSGSGREALQNVPEWSGGPPGCPGVIGRPCRMSGSGREALTDVRH